jgi:predicted acyl esterase
VSYRSMQIGEIRLQRRRAQVIQSTGTQFGPQLSQPLATSCTKVSASDNASTANYHTAGARAGGYTISGPATVLAELRVTGPSDQVAARLFDVGPDGQEQLIERGLFRPRLDRVGRLTQVFQLHPNIWHVEDGHSLKLELLPDDAPYSIVNPGSPDVAAQHPIRVSQLRLRVPVMDLPGSSSGLVKRPLRKFLPRGYVLARGFRR